MAADWSTACAGILCLSCPETEALQLAPEAAAQSCAATPVQSDSGFSAPSASPAASTIVVAQTANPPPAPPPGSLEPPRPDVQPLPAIPPDLPAPPAIDLPPTAPLQPVPIPDVTVQVKSVQVLGSTVFSAAELAAVVEPFIGKAATFEDLIAIRAAVTDLYTSRGFTTSGAFLPPQDISTGMITIQVVEGELERIEIQGLRRLREAYVRRRIELAARPPLNIQRLETALQLLQSDPLLRSVQAELTAGTTPGQSVLKLNLQEAPALVAELLVENRDSPSVGSIGGTAVLGHRNFFGWGDRVQLAYHRTEGVREVNFSYAVPLNPRNGTLNLRYDINTSEIVEPPFSAFGINSESETFSIGFRQPMMQTPTQELALGLGLDLRRSQTFLFEDFPFSFSEGADNGESKVTVLRFSQEWISRTPSRVLAARSQFSFGINAFGATINDLGVDGRFFSWLGQFQWVQALGRDVLLIARLNAQLTPDALLSIEQFGIGGIDTVRGYRENQRVADQGFAGSLEVRVPIVRRPDGIGTIELAPFFDVGKVWSQRTEVFSPATLMSAGLGLRWQSRWFNAQLSWGHQFYPINDAGDSLQDKGIFFSINLSPF